jgi:hypothetical protein
MSTSFKTPAAGQAHPARAADRAWLLAAVVSGAAGASGLCATRVHSDCPRDAQRRVRAGWFFLIVAAGIWTESNPTRSWQWGQ